MLRKSLVFASLLLTVSSMTPTATSGEVQDSAETRVQAPAVPHDHLYLIVQDKIRIKSDMEHLVAVTEQQIRLMEESEALNSHDTTEFGFDKKILALLREKVPVVRKEIAVLSTLQ